MARSRTDKTPGLGTVLGLILAFVVGIAAAIASIDVIGRSTWGGGLALLLSGVAVVFLGWRFTAQWQRFCAAARLAKP